MRTLAFLHKTFLENLREWKVLSLTLVFAPFFVYLMYGYFHAAPSTYTLLVKNNDRGEDGSAAAARTRGAQGLITAWEEATNADGSPVFRVTEVADTVDATRRVVNREADLLVEIPAGFSAGLGALYGKSATGPVRLTNRGNEASTRSTVAMAFSDYVAFQYVFRAAGAALPLDVAVEAIGEGRQPSEFDLYVPPLLVLALIMVLFTAAATLIKEVDKGTMSRLVLSKLSTAELLTAVSVNQALIGTAALLLTFLAALSVGYRTQGSLLTLVAVGALSTFGVVAISVLIAAFLRTIFELLTVGCFPFFILMFFSDCMFPLPKIPMFHVAGNMVAVSDLLPTAVTVRAFNKILNHGAGISDLGFELAAIVLLTAGYFIVGTWLFRRRHQRAG
jgi:ABC-2 type transport system permease protein